MTEFQGVARRDTPALAIGSVGHAFVRKFIGRGLLPDVCSYSVCVNVARGGLLVACRGLSITFFLSHFWDLAILKTLNTITREYHTYLGIKFIDPISLLVDDLSPRIS